MSKFIGSLVDVGVARETSRGTAVAPAYWVPKVSLSFDDKNEKVLSSESLGVIEDTHEAYVVNKSGEGDFEGEIRDKSFGLFLYSMMGSCSSAVKETTAYNHTFTIAQNNQHPSLSILVSDPISDVENYDKMFPLTMLNSLDLSVSLGEFAKFTAGFISKSSKDYTKQSTSYVAENKFVATHAIIKFASDLAGLAAATPVSIRKVDVSFAKNLMKDNALGTADPEDILNQMMSVEGNLELDYADRTYKNYMLDNTYKAMRIELINTGVTIGASSNPSIQINFPRVHFFGWEADRANDAIASQKISFKALRDVSGGNSMVSSVVLTNVVTSY